MLCCVLLSCCAVLCCVVMYCTVVVVVVVVVVVATCYWFCLLLYSFCMNHQTFNFTTNLSSNSGHLVDTHTRTADARVNWF